MHLHKLGIWIFTSSMLGATTACAQNPVTSPPIETATSESRYEMQRFVSGINVPWGMVWLNDRELLVTDREGELRLIRDGQLVDTPITGVPEVNAKSQGGLLDVEKDPNYAENGWIYLSYSGFEGEGEGTHTSVIRAKLNGMQLTEVEHLFHGTPNTGKNHHYGSRLEFDNQGYLYITVGDRGARETDPQRLDRDAGKVHRIYPDGSIPKDNPFVNQKSAHASVFTYGHRNPQGMALHPVTGEIWTHEHGPRGGDEINILEKGENYGWPVITYGLNYSGTIITDETHKQGMQQPDWQWTPSIAPSGMLFVTSERYPDFTGHLLVGSLKFQYLVLLELDGNTIKGHGKLFEGTGRIRSLAQGPDGYIYVGTEGNGIFRIVPKR